MTEYTIEINTEDCGPESGWVTRHPGLVATGEVHIVEQEGYETEHPIYYLDMSGVEFQFASSVRTRNMNTVYTVQHRLKTVGNIVLGAWGDLFSAQRQRGALSLDDLSRGFYYMEVNGGTPCMPCKPYSSLEGLEKALFLSKVFGRSIGIHVCHEDSVVGFKLQKDIYAVDTATRIMEEITSGRLPLSTVVNHVLSMIASMPHLYHPDRSVPLISSNVPEEALQEGVSIPGVDRVTRLRKPQSQNLNTGLIRTLPSYYLESESDKYRKACGHLEQGLTKIRFDTLSGTYDIANSYTLLGLIARGTAIQQLVHAERDDGVIQLRESALPRRLWRDPESIDAELAEALVWMNEYLKTNRKYFSAPTKLIRIFGDMVSHAGSKYPDNEYLQSHSDGFGLMFSDTSVLR